MEKIIVHPTSLGLWLGFLYIVASLVRFSLRSLPKKDYPPGPRCFPLLGNVHHFSSTMPFVQFTELAKQYGDIVGLKAGPGNIVVLNKANLVRELYEKRGGKYAGREFGHILSEHVIRDSKHIVFVPNDNFLRQWRSTARYILGPKGLEEVLPLQEASAADLMVKLAEGSNQPLEHFKTWALIAPMRAICGDRTLRHNPEVEKWFVDTQEQWLEILTPGRAPPVDIFPIVQYFPEIFAKWKKAARFVRKNQTSFYYMMLDIARKQLTGNPPLPNNAAAGQHEPLMAKVLREQQETKGKTLSIDEIAYIGGGLLDAAVDTTWGASLILVLALAAYPEVLKRLQDEVDSLRGVEHPPRGEDLEKLPYLKACHLEVRSRLVRGVSTNSLMMTNIYQALRWRPVAPSSVPRQLEADDTVGGYHLEKGTTIIQNTWAINHDPEDFENPDEFNPDRYLNNPYGTRMSPEDAKAAGRKQAYIFGAGRRICPGEGFAHNSVLMMTAKLVWAFDIIPISPVNTDMVTGFHGGIVQSPEGLEVKFVPRSAQHKQAVLDDFQRLSHVIE